MCAVLETVKESFVFVGCTQAAAEVKDGIVVVQGQRFQEALQLLETFADFRRVGFVGFCVSLVELVENSFSIAVSGIKGIVACVGFQCFDKG